MMDPQVAAAIRSGMIALGGGLAVKYGVDADIIPAIVGMIMAVGGGIWSAIGHRRNNLIATTKDLPGVVAVIAAPEVAHSSMFAADNKVITAAEAQRALR